MIVFAPASASSLSPAHTLQVLALGAQLFRSEDVPEIGNALATACAPSTLLLGPDNTVVGFALFCQGQCLSTKTSPNHFIYKQALGDLKGSMELAFFAIDPRYQGAGLGSKLLGHCLGQLPTDAFCWLVTEAENTVAPRLYTKHGFHCVHRITDAHPYPLLLWVRGSVAKFDAAGDQMPLPHTLSVPIHT
jgi:ribosomal protein S18 acetylase RimI-like enzyme